MNRKYVQILAQMVHSLITFKKDKPHMEEAIDSPVKFPLTATGTNHSGCIGLEQITTAFSGELPLTQDRLLLQKLACLIHRLSQ